MEIWEIFGDKKKKKRLTGECFSDKELKISNKKYKKNLKVLNLYSGIGGNRRYWKNCKVTAVEYDPEIAEIYQSFFPNDKVVIGDAHKYLLKNFKKYDIIWASPPCPTHSKFRFHTWRHDAKMPNGKTRKAKPAFPNMVLYEEIIFLSHWFEGKYIVENTKSYYEPLIEPQVVSRHYIWSNVKLTNIKLKSADICSHNMNKKQKRLGITLPDTKCSREKKEMVLNNCVHPKMGLHIYNQLVNCIKDERKK